MNLYDHFTYTTPTHFATVRDLVRAERRHYARDPHAPRRPDSDQRRWDAARATIAHTLDVLAQYADDLAGRSDLTRTQALGALGALNAITRRFAGRIESYRHHVGPTPLNPATESPFNRIARVSLAPGIVHVCADLCADLTRERFRLDTLPPADVKLNVSQHSLRSTPD